LSRNRRNRNARRRNGTTVVVASNTRVSRPSGGGRRRNRPARGKSVAQAAAASSYELTRVNPFLPQAAGCRSPDEVGYPSAVATLRNAGNLVTNGTGYQIFGCLPLTPYWGYQAATAIAGTAVWAGGAFNTIAQSAPLQNMATLGRTVGWGVRLSAEPAVTANSGHVWVTHVPLNYYTTIPYNDWPTTEAMFASSPLSEKYSLVELAERPLIIPGRAFDDGIYRYRDANDGGQTSTGVQVESASGWCAILLHVSGAVASATVLNIEVIHHIEYLQNSSALYGFIDVLPSPYVPLEMERTSLVESGAPIAVLEPSVDTYQKAASAFESFVDAGSRVLTKAMPLAQAAYSMYSLVHRKRSAPMSAIPAIEYKSDY
jgi:hypothetical protein